jgi:hypothetical protein
MQVELVETTAEISNKKRASQLDARQAVSSYFSSFSVCTNAYV